MRPTRPRSGASSARWPRTRSRSTAGSACLFYADVAALEDPWADERTGRVWIQGDLHAENFGTYMDGDGVLVFDVNDFDEAYIGHFTWDLTGSRQPGAARLAQGDVRRRRSSDAGRDATAGPTSTRCGAFVDGDRRQRASRSRSTPPTARSTRCCSWRSCAPASGCWTASPRSRATTGAARRRRPAPARRRRARRGARRRIERYLETIPEAKRLREGHLRRSRTSSAAPGSASAAPGCRRTTCSSRATTRRWTTTWCCR